MSSTTKTTSLLGDVMEKRARAYRDAGRHPRFLLIGARAFREMIGSRDLTNILRVIGASYLTTEAVTAVIGLEIVIDRESPDRVDVVGDSIYEAFR